MWREITETDLQSRKQGADLAKHIRHVVFCLIR